MNVLMLSLMYPEDMKTQVARDAKDKLQNQINSYQRAFVEGIKSNLLPDERLEIAVKDHGVGIADVAQARTPMYSTGGDDRSGMGFTIMESFMTSLQVTSKPGKGTTVHMKRRIVQRRKTA